MKHKAIVVSDLHLGTKDSQTKEFLEFLENNPTDLLILNGDIVDGWALSRGSKWRKQHTKVLTKLLKLSHTTQIIWIRGNHDEFIQEFIGTNFGNIQIREDYRLSFSSWVENDTYRNESYYVFHGDILDVFITKYKWIAKLGSIGYDIALWINRWYNRYRKWRNLPYRSISKDIKAGLKKAVNYVNDFEHTAATLAEKKGCNGVICGHIHQPSDRLINGVRYINSGDWVENRTAVFFERSGKISIVEF